MFCLPSHTETQIFARMIRKAAAHKFARGAEKPVDEEARGQITLPLRNQNMLIPDWPKHNPIQSL